MTPRMQDNVKKRFITQINVNHSVQQGVEAEWMNFIYNKNNDFRWCIIERKIFEKGASKGC